MEEQNFLFSSCTLVNNELFFIETQSGLPAMMELGMGNITYCDVMEGYIFKSGDIVDFIDCYKSKIYILETSGLNVLIFDFMNKRCRYLELDCNNHAWSNFAAFERYESIYYIFPKYGNRVIVLDANTDELKEIPNCFDKLDEIQCTCRVNNQIWIVPQGINGMYVFDLITRKIKFYQLEKVLENCVDAFSDGTDIYILNQFGIIYKWNITNGVFDEITALETRHDENESICRIVYAGNKLILLPSLGMDIKILNLSTYETEIYHDYPLDFIYHEIRWSKYYRNCGDNEYYYFAMRLGNYILKICKKDGKLSWIKPQLPLNEEKMKIKKLLLEQKLKLDLIAKKIIYEEGDLSIVQMLNIDMEGNYVKKETGIGKMVYERVR